MSDSSSATEREPEEPVVEEPTEAPEPVPAPSRWPKVLVVAATVLAVLATVTVWARTQLLDTDEWVGLSSELLERQEVREALSVYVVETLYADGQVTAGLEERLPDNAQGLAGPVAGALRGPLTDGVEVLLGSEEFRTLWEAVNRVAHQRLVAILRGEPAAGVTTSGGEVALELRPLVVGVGASVGLAQDRLDAIPADAGRIVIFESDELDTVQRTVELAEFIAWFLFVIVVVLYALAVYLAWGRRIDVLRNVGWSLMIVGVVVLAARAVAVRALVDIIVANPGNRPVAEASGTVATALLRQMGWSALTYGILIVLFTSLLGHHPSAAAVRRALAPALNASSAAVVGGTVAVLFLLFWWSPGRAFDSWTTGLVLIGLVSGAVAALRARTMEEFPDAGVGGAADAVV